MDSKHLIDIIQQWAHSQYDHMGPQSKSALEKADAMIEKIENKTYDTNDLHWIMDIQNKYNFK